MPITLILSNKQIGAPEEPYLVSKECSNSKPSISFISPEDICLSFSYNKSLGYPASKNFPFLYISYPYL